MVPPKDVTPVPPRPVASVPEEMFDAFVASVEQDVAALERSEHARRATVMVAPEDVCINTLLVPPVALRSAPVPPRARPRVPEEMLEALVVSVEHDVAPLERLEHASWATVIVPPTLVCISTLLVPPVALRFEPVPPCETPSVPLK